MVLSPEQIESYRLNGFVVVENVLSAAELATARGVVEEFVEHSRYLTASDDTYALEPGHSPEDPRITRGISAKACEVSAAGEVGVR
jgi:hypothetical protein